MPSSLNKRKQTLSFEDFSNADPNPLTWYDLLPGDGIKVCGIPEMLTLGQLRDNLISQPEPSLKDIDVLAAHLLSIESLLEPRSSWVALARRMSKIMSKQLTAFGNRPLRMRAQRLNFYIEALTAACPSKFDRDLIVDERELAGIKPWDFLTQKETSWWIASGSPNVYRNECRVLDSWTMGLPTQIDLLKNGSVSFGSMFSNGAFIFESNVWSTLRHEYPVPLVFDYENVRYFLDCFGQVWSDFPRNIFGRVSCGQVHFARHFNGMLYCMDNSDYGHITIFDMHSGLSQRQSVLPVQVCNDIAVVDNSIYLIDKQQGSIFKFANDFTYISRALTFGRGENRLLDPLGLKVSNGYIFVTSWLSNKVTVMRSF